jgi:GDP-4-dehydro-6-deoxy-D-mannose reductase
VEVPVMHVIVTGAGGLIGRYLVDALVQQGHVVQAWTRTAHPEQCPKSVQAVAVDITDQQTLTDCLHQFTPDLIVHLAAQSYPARSWEDPVGTYHVNVLGAINLLESVRTLPKQPRILIAGSSAEYAEPTDGRPIVEGAATEPNSPYAASKLAADQLAQLYVRRYDLDLVRFRPFYFVGPHKTGDVCSDFARRIVAIERGQERVMRVGSLDVARDILDVRDGVTAILLIAKVGERGGLYNVCSGRAVTIGNVLATFRRLASVPFEVVEDPALLRPLEQKNKIGDPAKLLELGWSPCHVFDDTLNSILNYWRSAVNTMSLTP